MAGYYQQPYPQFYQPQNIYQQLGQPQPQPHLQAHPTYVTQQQQQQQVPQAPAYSYPQQPTYPQPSPTPTVRRVPSFVPPYNQYQLPAQPPPPSQVFAPAQPVYSSYSQPHVPQIPQSSIAVPRNGNFTQIPRPPIAPSANLAQQAQAAQAQAQAQQSQPSSRRPLPKPSSTGRTPALPPSNPLPVNTLQRATTESGPARPFPQPIATSLSSQSTTSVSSPTRSRPLPTPTVANKRTTVDLGKPTNFAAIPVAQSSSSNFTSTPSASRRTPSPVKAPPTNDATPTRLSRTTSFATMNAADATTKRRTSPPTFRSQPASASSSPTKENPPPMKWTSSNSATPNSKFTTTAESSSPPKKFTPIWKRTIPDYPAPVFGYAAGMVSEPHPKPAQPTAQATPTKANPGATPQGKGKSAEKGKESKSLLPYLQDSPGQSQQPPQQFNYRQPAVPQPPHQQQRMSGWRRAPATAQQEETTEDDDSDDSDSDEDEDGDDDEDTDVESAYQYEGSDYNSEDHSGRGGRGRDPPSAKGRLRNGYTEPHKEYVKEPSRKKGTAHVAKPKKKKRPALEVERTRRALEDRLWEQEQQRSYGGYDDRDRRREPSDRDQRRYTYTEDREEVRRPAYRHERSYSERDRKLEYDDELDAPRRRSPTKSAPSRDLDWPQERRKDGPSPQRGIRNVPQRRSGPGRRYSDEEDEEDYDDDEEDNHYRRGEQRRAKDFRERGWNDDPRHSRGTGLPQPPPMVRDVGGDAIRRKVKKVPIRDFDDEENERNMALRFASFKVSNGDRSPNSSNGSGGNWPTNLPRLPRTPGGGTPGSANSGGEGGYFDPRPNSASASTAASSSGSGFRGRTVIHPRENLRNIDLEDSPPRPSSTILRSPSPAASSSSAFSQRRALPQPQGQPRYDAPLTSAGEQLQRRRSLYSMPSKQQQQSEPSARERRPQSQMYGTSNVDHSYGEQSRQRHDTQPSFSIQSKPQLFGPHPRNQPQTPAPPRSVNIESPAPIGGRERMADIPRIEQGGEDHHGKRHDGLPTINVDSPRISNGGMNSAPPSIPMINIDSGPSGSNNSGPQINVSGPQINVEPAASRQGSRKEAPRVQVYEIPGVSVSGPEYDDGPNVKVSGPDDGPRFRGQQQRPQSQSQFGGSPSRRGGLICGGCNGPIIGRIVSAMGSRWHPQCFRCTVCEELLEHVSSYEHDGRPYCHLDYHENFAPKCYSCKTAIIEEQFISLDDPALGKRTYHTQHFFCAECGDPFLSPSISADSKGELALSGDGDFEGFTVFRGHPYCEPCHVRLRLPKCKRCKRSIRDNDQAVEALGGKWCWSCFVCDSCSKPFEDPSFFQRDDRPYCERCFSILLRNEI